MAKSKKGIYEMIAEIKKAGASTPAIRNKLQYIPYPKAVSLSSLKIQTGELLLLLFTKNGQPDGWQRFDRLLRQLYEGGAL